jgi:thioredoxin reductase (NADPH)
LPVEDPTAFPTLDDTELAVLDRLGSRRLVGDVRAGSTKRVAAAVGEGSTAVRSVHEYLAFTTLLKEFAT